MLGIERVARCIEWQWNDPELAGNSIPVAFKLVVVWVERFSFWLILFALASSSADALNVTVDYVGLSAFLGIPVTSFKPSRFLSTLGSTVPLGNASQWFMVSYSPASVASSTLVEFAVIDGGGAENASTVLAASLLSVYPSSSVLSSEFAVSFVVVDPAVRLVIPPAEAAEDAENTNGGAGTFAVMMVLTILLVVGSIALCGWFLRWGQYGATIMWSPQSSCNCYIMGVPVDVPEADDKENAADDVEGTGLPAFCRHVDALATSSTHTLLVASGCLYVMGDNTYGELGIGAEPIEECIGGPFPNPQPFL